MKTYIIAEVGPNHNGSIDLALEMVEKLSVIGVDAIKFQLTNPENLYSKDSFKATYQKNNMAPTETAIEMSKRIQLSREEHIQVFNRCTELGVEYLCTAFDLQNLIFLDKSLPLSYFKIASGEIFSLDILDYMSKRKKKIILSTGMASFEDIQTTLSLLNRNFTKDITVLHCISNYPAKAEEVNLRVMQEIKRRFNCKVGFSDHTLGNTASIASVIMGASIIEKHVTLDKSLPGPDHKASATIEEFGILIKEIRRAEVMLGVSEKIYSEQQIEIANVARKSIVTAKDLKKGQIISEEDICYKRPGTGFSPLEKTFVVGKRVTEDVEIDRILKPNHLN